MSVLPEVSDLPALSVDYFPTPWQAALVHFSSALHQIRFVEARDAGDRAVLP